LIIPATTKNNGVNTKSPNIEPTKSINLFTTLPPASREVFCISITGILLISERVVLVFVTSKPLVI
jgi:hypothetical protein